MYGVLDSFTDYPHGLPIFLLLLIIIIIVIFYIYKLYVCLFVCLYAMNL